MKKLFLILPVLVVFLFACTMGGVEVGLVGTWNFTDAEGDIFDGTTDHDGTWVIACNDTFTINISWKKSGAEFKLTGNGTLTANYQTKIITVKYSKFEVKRNGTVIQTDPDDDDEMSYILNSNTLITKNNTITQNWSK